MFVARAPLASPLEESLVPPERSSGSGGRSPGGLGRGLAGILDRFHDDPAPTSGGLSHLLGPRPSTPPRVRQFVADTALEAIAEGFDAEAVVFVRRDDGPGPHVVSSRVPPSWGDGSSLTFELFGHLWTLLDGADPGTEPAVESTGRGANGWRVIHIGPYHAWLGCQRVDGGRLAAAVVRAGPPTERERSALVRIVRSVARAIGAERSGLPPGTELVAEVGEVEPDRYRAQLVIRGRGPARPVAAEGRTAELAVAGAALELHGADARVDFAGRTDIDGVTVSMVVLSEADPSGDRSPLVGLAVTDHGAPTGPALAALSALGAGE